jgi:hypothetical protein
VSPENFDLRLQNTSPCIDAGSIVTIEKLGWKSSFAGEAPDIGAFDENRSVIGPFFKTDTMALAHPLTEHTRITQLITDRDSSYLSFSYPVLESSIAGNVQLIDETGSKSPLSDFIVLDNGYTIGFLAPFSVKSAIISGPLKGVNGLDATNWANDAVFEPEDHDNVVVYMLHPQLEPRVPPPPSGVYINGSIERSIVPKGTQIEVKATSDEGYAFERWEGDLQGTDSVVTLTLDKSAWIIGHFARVEDDEDTEPVLAMNRIDARLYPNPSEGIIHFDSLKNDISVRVTDMQGQVSEVKTVDRMLDLRSFEDGLYILQIHEGESNRILKVLLKKR